MKNQLTRINEFIDKLEGNGRLSTESLSEVLTGANGIIPLASDNGTCTNTDSSCKKSHNIQQCTNTTGNCTDSRNDQTCGSGSSVIINNCQINSTVGCGRKG